MIVSMPACQFRPGSLSSRTNGAMSRRRATKPPDRSATPPARSTMHQTLTCPYYSTFGPDTGPLRWRDVPGAIGLVAAPGAAWPVVAVAYPIGRRGFGRRAVAVFRLRVGERWLIGRWECVGREFVRATVPHRPGSRRPELVAAYDQPPSEPNGGNGSATPWFLALGAFLKVCRSRHGGMSTFRLSSRSAVVRTWSRGCFVPQAEA